MRRIEISTFAQLHRGLSAFRDKPTTIFRGQSDAQWPLVPKAGREPFKQYQDGSLFADWKDEARPLIGECPRTELEWMALAQHHGLATRMLDWTWNPMVAAFFAVWEDRDCDAALYAFEACDIIASDWVGSPFEGDSNPNVFVWHPNPFTVRVARQRGIFTVHQPATQPLYILRRSEKLVCFIIRRDYRDELRRELSFYGYTRASLFPDLDGLSAHINWKLHTYPTL